MEKDKLRGSVLKPIFKKSIIIVLVLLLGLSAGVVLKVNSFKKSDFICKGVKVAGIELGGKSISEASEIIRSWAKNEMNQEITLSTVDFVWKGIAGDLGAYIKWQDSIDKAYKIGRKDSLIENVKEIFFDVGAGKEINPQWVVDKSILSKTLKKIASSANRPNKDASIEIVDGKIIIQKEVVGVKLKEDEAASLFENAIKTNKNQIKLPIVPDPPKILSSDLSSIDGKLSSYKTTYNPGKINRTHNLSLAARAIHKKIVLPGEIFSYNESVGPRALNTGFKDAPIFVNGRMEPGVGGGICQVSSTLYNAVLLAGLEVIERTPHSRPVPYVSPGRDATVAYNATDFKFKNNTSSPIFISSNIKGGTYTVDLYGSLKDKKNIKIFTSKPIYTPNTTKTIFDESVEQGKTKVLDEGSSGVVVTVYKKIIGKDGKEIVKVVSNDKYRPQPKIIGVAPEVNKHEQKKETNMANLPSLNSNGLAQ